MKKKFVLWGLVMIIFITLTGCIKNDQEIGTQEIKASENDVEDLSSVDSSKTELERKTEKDNSTDTKIAGNDAYGYINIPTSWGSFEDVDLPKDTTVMQFADPSGFDIITLNAWEFTGADAEQNASILWGKLEEEGAKDVTGARVKLNERDAYQVYGYYENENKMLVIWLFDTDDGMSHYISAESSMEGIMSIVHLIENTYELNL